MSDFALLLLSVATAFACLAWGRYWVQRRRLLGRAPPPPPAPALPAGPNASPPPGQAARATVLALAPSDLAPSDLAPADLAPADLAPTSTSAAPSTSLRDAPPDQGAPPLTVRTASEAGAARESAGATEAKRVAAASAPGAARAAEGAADAASAAASAAAATPGSTIVTVEPGSAKETAVVAATPDEGAENAPVVVLVHGILGFDQFRVLRWRFHYFRGVADHLRRVGVNAYVVRVPALDAIPARGLALAEFVKALPHRRVTLIAHSMGGLDARYAITRLGLAERVPVLVTVATPHRGTPLADLMERRPFRAARRLAAAIGLSSEAIGCLTTERMARFNDEVPDASGVTYACVPCGRRARPGAIHPLLRPAHAYLRRVAGPNDGLVPVSSQLWGAVVEELEADHWAQVGWSRRFDAPLFYADVVVHLAKLGLLPPPAPAGLPAPAAPPSRAAPRLGTALAHAPRAERQPEPGGR